jgi:hypothetical protein
MDRFDKVNRRLHLYLGLFLMPWLLMYGVSSFILIHQAWFRAEQEPPWETLFEKECRRPLEADADLRSVAQDILKDHGLEGAFWADKPNADTLRITRFSFWGSTRLTYSIREARVRAEHQRVRGPQAVVRMHFRGGYGQPTFWDKFWGFMVDLACAAIVIWVASGVVMWWRLRRLRAWGALTLGGGILTFLLLVWTL